MSERPYVVVIGGANIDVKCRTHAAVVPATSNPGAVRTAPGGVARNVAENLARLGAATQLITVVGRDADGDRLLDDTSRAGVAIDHVHRIDAPTGMYVAVLDPRGELVVAVAAMDATNALTPDVIDARRDLLAASALVILDCNVPEPTLTRALCIARDAAVPVMVDPVSVPKAARLQRALHDGTAIHTITPNVDELAALVGRATLDDAELASAAESLHARGVAHVWVRRGARGSLLSSAAPNGSTSLEAPVATVVDVTGAGDAMLAAYAHAILLGHAPDVAARRGHAAAALTLASEHTVSPRMSAAALDASA